MLKSYVSKIQNSGNGESAQSTVWLQERSTIGKKHEDESWTESRDRIFDDVLPFAMVPASDKEGAPFVIGSRQRKRPQYPSVVRTSGRLL